MTCIFYFQKPQYKKIKRYSQPTTEVPSFCQLLGSNLRVRFTCDSLKSVFFQKEKWCKATAGKSLIRRLMMILPVPRCYRWVSRFSNSNCRTSRCLFDPPCHVAPWGETRGSMAMTQPGLQFRSTLTQPTAPGPFQGLGQRAVLKKKLQLYWKQTNKTGIKCSFHVSGP